MKFQKYTRSLEDLFWNFTAFICVFDCSVRPRQNDSFVGHLLRRVPMFVFLYVFSPTGPDAQAPITLCPDRVRGTCNEARFVVENRCRPLMATIGLHHGNGSATPVRPLPPAYYPRSALETIFSNTSLSPCWATRKSSALPEPAVWRPTNGRNERGTNLTKASTCFACKRRLDRWLILVALLLTFSPSAKTVRHVLW